MAIENKANLINQIIQSSKLQGKALEDLKSRLAQLSEAELQAELTKALSGDNFYDDMGLKVEYSNKPNSSNTVSLTNSHKTVNLTEEEAKDLSIDYISSNLQKAMEITMHTNNGWISKAYDFGKNLFNTELSSKNVNEVVNKEHDCISYLIKSKEGKLTKREYYEMNKARLKEMFLNRMKNQDDTGLDAIDKYREEYSRKEFEELIDKYLTQTIDTISTMEGIKLSQHQLITATEEVEAELLEKIANEAKKNKGIAPSKSSDISNFVDIKNNPAEFHPFNSDELMTFEETYLLERGVEFSISEMEELQQAQGEMTFVTSAYNKLQGLKNSVENFKTSYEKATQEYYDEYGVVIAKGEEPNAEERKKEALDILNNYYQLNPKMAIDDLQNIINKQFLNLKLSLNEEGQLELNFNEFHQNDVSKNKSLNLLMHGLNQHQINRFNNLLSNKTIDEYISDYQKEYSEALGERNVEELAKAMEKDNIEFIDTTTGVASAAGMGLLLVGGVFVAAPVVLGSLGVAVPATLSTGVIATGANLATAVGGKIAIGGMATRNILGITEAHSREEKSQEEITRRYKDLAMDVSGFIIGSFAGATGFKNGMKAFQKGAINKLGAKAMEVSIDASISVAGDLAMIGILDYDQDLKTTIKQNGIGILISTLTGIKTGQVYEKHSMAKDVKMPNSNQKTQTSDEAIVNAKNNESEINVQNSQAIKKEANSTSQVIKSITQELASKGFFSLDKNLKIIKISDNKFEANLTIKNGNQLNIKENSLEVLIDKINFIKYTIDGENKNILTGADYKPKEIDIEKYKQENPLNIEHIREIYAESTYSVLEKYYNKYPEFITELLNDDIFKINYINDEIDIAYNVDSFLNLVFDYPEQINKIRCYMEGGYSFSKIKHIITNEINLKKEFCNKLRNNQNLTENDISELSILYQEQKHLDEDISYFSNQNLSKSQILNEIGLLNQKRNNLRETLEKQFNQEMNELKTTLGEEFYYVVKWEQFFTDETPTSKYKEVLYELNASSKFFARTTTNEQRYRKNFDWARRMYQITEKAEAEIIKGANSNDILNLIADLYGRSDRNNLNNDRNKSGILRNNEDLITPFNNLDCYPEYYDKIKATLDSGEKRQKPYNDVALTTFNIAEEGHGIMFHPKASKINNNLKYVALAQENLQPYIEKVQKGKTLSKKELKTIHENISEIYFLLANAVPYYRGSNGIADIYMRSLYKSLKIDMPALKKNVSLDLEAFCINLSEYKNNWLSFFENDKPNTINNDNSKFIDNLIEIPKRIFNSNNVKTQSKIEPNHWVSYNKFYESDIDKAVDDIIAHYTKSEPKIRKIIKSFGFEDLGKFSARIKSDYSLRDKIKNFLKDHPSATHKDVWDEIRDCFGMRSIVKSEDYTTHPEVKKLIDTGDIKGAKIKAAELQSEPAVAKVKEIILANKKGDNRISVARITNYVSKDGIPYFSEAQLSELKQFGFDNDVEIDYVKKAAPDDIKAGEMDFDAKPTTRSQPSGYTALQMNFVTKNGDTIEWQYRGEEVDRFAEGEHIPYDLRTDKDITGGNKDLEEFYSDFKSMLINMGKDEYEAYNTYLDAHYTHLRNLELGFESTPPKLQDFAPKGYTFSHKLEAENLIKLSKIAHYLKNGKITLEIALDQYYNI